MRVASPACGLGGVGSDAVDRFIDQREIAVETAFGLFSYTAGSQGIEVPTLLTDGSFHRGLKGGHVARSHRRGEGDELGEETVNETLRFRVNQRIRVEVPVNANRMDPLGDGVAVDLEWLCHLAFPLSGE